MPAPAQLVGPLDDSALALRKENLEPGDSGAVGDETSDTLVYVASGTGSVRLAGSDQPLQESSAALVPAGEEVRLAADSRLSLVVATVGAAADRHAPLGPREAVVVLGRDDAEWASGSRAFKVLFGPHNGSTRATFFAGFIPPGRAPWHYHLYDEIVWVPEGPGRLHIGETTTELGPGSAFRLRPRQVHIVENLSSDAEMTIIGVFTPAGSPSAAYLTPEVAAEYGSAEPVS
jgi:quercetin dioxygenase-like cupin family protein